MTDDAKIKTVEYTEPSPIPENNWLWRRLYVFVVTGLLCAHIGWLSWNSDDVTMLRETVRNDQLLIMLYALMYLAGASAEAIGRIIAQVRTSRKETIVSAPPPANLTENSVDTQPKSTALPDKPGWSK